MVNVPVGLVVLPADVAVRRGVEGRPPATFDVPGSCCSSGPPARSPSPLIEGPRAGWLSAEILGLFVCVGSALAVFRRLGERRSGDPMMDLTLFATARTRWRS